MLCILRLFNCSTWLLQVLALLIGSLGLSSLNAAAPNVVVILADDLGFSDLGAYGGEIQTPVLDGLANEGLRFSQFYSAGRCWPSRSVLLTGYQAPQVAMDPIYGSEWPEWTRLMPHYLKPAGYRSYLSGKWHVRHGPSDPDNGGFDRSYRLRDHDRFFSPKGHYLDDQPLPEVSPDEGYYATIATVDYALEFLGEHEKETPGQPFLLYLGFTAPHFPLHALPEDIARYEGMYREGWDVLRRERYVKTTSLGLTKGPLAERRPEVRNRWSVSEERLQAEIDPGESGHAVAWDELTDTQQEYQARKMAVHAAMVDRLDREIGRVVEWLRVRGELDNTLILFMSDNGATSEQMIRGEQHVVGAPLGSADSYLSLGPGWSTASNSPLSLHKHWTHEGGIASPLIAFWPEGIKARGEIRHTVAHFFDIIPTLTEAAGVEVDPMWNGMLAPPFPGTSLLPVFEEDPDWLDRPIFFGHQGNQALRFGDWKISMRRDNDGIWELYHIAEDRGETRDLSEQFPQKKAQMIEMWEKLDRQYYLDGLRGRDPEAKAMSIHKSY